MTQPATHVIQLSYWEILAVVIVIGMVCSAVRNELLNLLARHREAAELRHKRRVELARAQNGLNPDGKIARPPACPTWWGADPPDWWPWTPPAAAIASPPGARRLPGTATFRGEPGPCRHERLIPVITEDGEVRRWVCANHQRCEAVFPPDTALYEPKGETHG